MPPPTMPPEQETYNEALARIESVYRSEGTLLDLTALGLTRLPPEIGQLTNLTTLSLDRNQLSILPREIGKLSKLTTLSLSDNQLSILPPEIGQLAELK